MNSTPVRFRFLCLAMAGLARIAFAKGEGHLAVDEVSPFIGTAGHGHTYPGATVPFGFVQLSPDTRLPTDPWTVEGWDGCSGYFYRDDSLLGFSHTHLSGTGIGDMGDVLVLPVTGSLNGPGDYRPISAARFRSHFDHANELARPGYYRVLLDRYQVTAELTATAHVGLHRLTFPDSDQSHVLVDLVHGIGNHPIEAALSLKNRHTLTGYRIGDGWIKHRTIYFAIESSQDFRSAGFEVDGVPTKEGVSEAKGREVRCHLDFSTRAKESIVLRVALSPTSVEEAEANLKAEADTASFDEVSKAATDAWEQNLSRVAIESSNPNVRRIFYTALYHAMSAPTLYNNADGSYLGADQTVHRADGIQHYSTMSLWDTFRAENPLLTLVEPDRVNDIVGSLIAFSQQSADHALPMWPLAATDTECMIGYHAVPVIYDAYRKGFHGFDAEKAFEAMKATALSTRNRQDEYQRLGYVPWVTGQQAATSRTLEFAYDDWCLAQMAHALGKTADEAVFARRAESYRNVWDPKSQFFRARDEGGGFHEPFDPSEVAGGDDTASGSYTEANAWEYAFGVMQDVPALIQLYGGNEAFVRRLDAFFNQDSFMRHWRVDVAGLVGQYSHGNEPDQQAPYLYALAGAQYKTAQRVRQIQLTQYDDTPEGICGNDDCGQISAWYVWSALGLYPVNPASGVYVIGSPLVEKATIATDRRYASGGTFTIIARNVSNQCQYIQSAKLNGKPLLHPWITHEEIAQGGTLELEMGLLPSKMWNSGEAITPQ